MIIYSPTEKSQQGLNDLGFNIVSSNNAFIIIRLSDGVEDDPADVVTVQAFIDTFDYLSESKDAKIVALSTERGKRISEIIPKSSQMLELFNAIFIMQKGNSANARQTAKLSALAMTGASIIQASEAFEDAEVVINAMTTVDEVDAYDVSTAPVWP